MQMSKWTVFQVQPSYILQRFWRSSHPTLRHGKLYRLWALIIENNFSRRPQRSSCRSFGVRRWPPFQTQWFIHLWFTFLICFQSPSNVIYRNSTGTSVIMVNSLVKFHHYILRLIPGIQFIGRLIPPQRFLIAGWINWIHRFAGTCESDQDFEFT